MAIPTEPLQDDMPIREPVAIVGMGLRLPGKIHSPESLWQLLVNGADTRGPIPISRYNPRGFYSASKRVGTIGVEFGHFLDESDAIESLDSSFFGMSKAELEKLDPQQRMLLEVVWECMENGAQRGWHGTRTGVFVGTWGDDWLDRLAKDAQQSGGIANVSGAGDFAISNRVSYDYDLRGPSGECDAAIVTGTNLILTPTQTIAQTEAGVLSPTGECRPFDASANGYARGEAINAILIRRLCDAVSANDPIRAVIRSTAVNSDGRSAGITVPNPDAHEELTRQAYATAGISNIADTPFIEVHGTGTPAGDPLELQAIANVFGVEQETYVGSVKANLGHGEGASGLTSIIKAVMALENKMFPPQVNFVTPNPRIPFEDARLVVPRKPVSWPASRPERISVNSFGITGANARVILESPTWNGLHRKIVKLNDANRGAHTATVAFKYAKSHPDCIQALAYTLAHRRDHLPHRAFCIANGVTLGDISTARRGKRAPYINFVFTGQGAQWLGMGRELMYHFPEFKADLEHFSTVLARLPNPPTWKLLNELLHNDEESRLNKAEFAQPLCTALQVALVNFLHRLGIFPSAVIGHSSGEIAAAYTAQAITADEAIIIAYYRVLVVAHISQVGAMAVVGMSRTEAFFYLEPGVSVACENSPNSITLSGDKQALVKTIEQIKLDDETTFVRFLKTDIAYHSHHMKDLGSIYETHLQRFVKAKPPTIQFISSVAGQSSTSVSLDAEYWRRNLESPVEFLAAVRAMVARPDGDQLFLEIGPHAALASPIRQIFFSYQKEHQLMYQESLMRGQNALSCILEMLGQLYLQAILIRREALLPEEPILTDLPPYPWNHEESHLLESRVVREWRTRPYPPHELLGSRILEGNDLEPTWRNMLRLRDAAWLEDHKVIDDIVFPCAGYIAMIGEAIKQVVHWDDFTIRDFQSPCSAEFPRKVHSPYSVFDGAGLHYGPAFQGISCVSAMPRGKTAAATLGPPVVTSSSYALHPTTIDQCLQLLGLATAEGLPRRFRHILLPTGIDSLYIHPRQVPQPVPLHAVANCGANKSTLRGQIIAAENQHVLLSIQGCQLSMVETPPNDNQDDRIAAARLSWRPDMDFISLANLMVSRTQDPAALRRIETYGLLCAAEIQRRLLEDGCPVEGLWESYLYAITGDRIDASELFISAGHTNPTMRILEIGAGTGGTTLVTLQALYSILGERLYSKYTFTDISSGFFPAAKERFASYPGLEYRVLDIGKDPVSQGFEADSYDLIIASNVIHATESLMTTLGNVRTLLQPRGHFFLQELIPSAAKMINIIMGPLPGWWLGAADGRASEPIVTPERWDCELRAAGFAGAEAIVQDDPHFERAIGVNIIARPMANSSAARGVTLLIRENQKGSNSVETMEKTLTKKDYCIYYCVVGEEVPAYQDIICLLEVDSPFIGIGHSRLLWIMGSAQVKPKDPLYGCTLGFARSIRAELSASFATLEIDQFDPEVSGISVEVFEKFQDTASLMNPDYEFAIQEYTVLVARYHWTKVSKELTVLVHTKAQALALGKETDGNLYWSSVPLGPPGHGEVAISPRYCEFWPEKHFNNKRYDLPPLEEGSGVIIAVGAGVHTLRPGDRVMMIGSQCLSTRLVLPADHVVSIPDLLSLEEAATMPIAYCTAIYSLIKVANVQKGQSILIHSACEDIGLAALQICQMIGAEIYCTVSDDKQAEYLTGTFGIPSTHIIFLLKRSFVQALLQATNQRGVDVVLNTLFGKLLHASWKCVALCGKMIQIGGNHVKECAALDSRPFGGNRMFVGVDISSLPNLYQELLCKTVTLYKKGFVQAAIPHRLTRWDQLKQVSDSHTDRRKPVVSIPHGDDIRTASTVRFQATLHPDAAYLLVGGLGGLGRAVSTWMIEHGARHLIYLSRTVSHCRYTGFIDELQSQGCSVQIIQGDVSNAEDVQVAVNQAWQPIVGVLHMAMVLCDRPLLQMSHPEWKTVLLPRIQGTWNLHGALLHVKLDFFVIFGSISGSFGITHQANYGAANTFQDAFVQYRHAHSLPVSILNIGAMADVGYVSQNQVVEDYFQLIGMPFMAEEDFFEALLLSLHQQSPATAWFPTDSRDAGFTITSQLSLGIRATKPMNDPSNRVFWKQDRRADIYRNIEAATLQAESRDNVDADPVGKLMNAIRESPVVLDQEEIRKLLAKEIGVHIYQLMLLPVTELDVSKPLATLGVDSLVIIGIRSWLRRKLEVDISTLEILNGDTIDAIAGIVAKRLKGKYGHQLDSQSVDVQGCLSDELVAASQA
ncbi:hypothetical protein NUU61_008414 [Penicillium alfredii]|uniref:Carrier domain-containing protein n=1 Tax=Penicillium alfredii TaxID=1506179 RepID=A0A9W9K010_9EURO|nr:uncharacterized protein NUU61_008414 [Penicillium alfredii]KAJ5087107.1 hypothetical protein NUU61_008414 [Penicillium alfredii]